MGMVIFVGASIALLYIETIYFFIFWRFIQGLGAGVAYVLSLAIISDLYEERERALILSLGGSVTALSPAAAPVLGAYVLEYFNWRTNFSLVSFLGFISLLFIAFGLPETRSSSLKQPFELFEAFKRYKRILKHRKFIALSCISSLPLCGLWAFFAVSPFVLIECCGMTPKDFGFYTAIGVLAYIFGALTNHISLNFFSIRTLLKTGFTLTIIGSVGFLLISPYKPYLIWEIRLMTLIFVFGAAFIFSNSITEAMNFFPASSGMASAIISAVEISLSSLGVFLIGFFEKENLVGPAAIMVISSIVPLFLYHFQLKDPDKKALKKKVKK
jgi:DHA1 family bicyclomycin/chloramphenicol resistance-like MFS transporter